MAVDVMEITGIGVAEQYKVAVGKTMLLFPGRNQTVDHIASQVRPPGTFKTDTFKRSP